jgi:hypothetical protein
MGVTVESGILFVIGVDHCHKCYPFVSHFALPSHGVQRRKAYNDSSAVQEL